MARLARLAPLSSLALTSLLLSACATTTAPSDVPPGTPATLSRTSAEHEADGAAVVVEAAKVRPHVAFLASDDLRGRAPGTEDDVKTQAYVIDAMKSSGLQPGFSGEFRQPFEVTDGVRLQEGQASELRVGGQDIDHAIVPFSGSGSATARVVFVGYGIAAEGKGTGDYAGGMARKVAGSIVVALEGPPPGDPHMSPVAVRPQQKLINARDHGAVGFILWEPTGQIAWPNHGDASDLELPAVWVGAAGTEAMLAAFGRRPSKDGAIDIPAGARAKGKATVSSPVEPVIEKTANIIGRLPGNGDSERILVVGAHMDHLGMGTSSSLAVGEHAVHNGADDNASGVAVVLEIARALAATDASKRPFDVLFIAFGAEEMGLIGSKRYVTALGDTASTKVAAMLNFDMVGRLGDEGLIVAGTGTSKVWPKLLADNTASMKVQKTEDGYGPSDHGSFYEAGVPVLHFFTGSHSDYHKPSDDIEKINFDGAARIGNVALNIVEQMEAEHIEPDYIKVARKESARGGFRVSMGTIPDYGANVDGVRLSGVRDGGPAAAAGLRKGDVIVSLAGRPVHNLDDYMASFAVLEPGQEIDVQVMRDGETVDAKMTPAAPSRRP
jgi:hypothetical protein